MATQHDLTIDTSLVAEEIRKHITVLRGLDSVVIQPGNHQEIQQLNTTILSHLEQVIALAMSTAPREIQLLVQSARDAAAMQYAAMQPEEVDRGK